MFGDISRMLAGQGPLNWDAARQFAIMSATGGTHVAGWAGCAGHGVAERRSVRADQVRRVGEHRPPPRRRRDGPRRSRGRAVGGDARAVGHRDARGVPAAVHRDGDLTGSAGRRRRGRLGPHDADDGRAVQDDGAGHARHGGRFDGRQPGRQGVRCLRPPDPTGHTGPRARATHDRCVRRRVGDLTRRDAAVGARTRTRRPDAVLGAPRRRSPPWPRAASRRRIPARSVGGDRQAHVDGHGIRGSDGRDATCLR